MQTNMSAIPAKGSWRQEDDYKLVSSLDWEARSCLRKPKQRRMREGEGRERRGEGEYQQIGESIYQRDSVCNQNKEISSACNMDVED